jgi:hypothetical protein
MRGVLKTLHTIRRALRFHVEAHLYSYISKYGIFPFRAVEKTSYRDDRQHVDRMTDFMRRYL